MGPHTNSASEELRWIKVKTARIQYLSNSSTRRGSSSPGCACEYIVLCFKIMPKLLKKIILEIWLGGEINH
jgi:hypothetical protein